MVATILLVGLLFTVLVLVPGFAPGREVNETGATEQSKKRLGWTSPPVGTPVSLTVPSQGLYRGRPASYWASRYRFRTAQLQQARRALHDRWEPTVTYALRLASAVFGVSYWELRSVAWCESKHNPYATNGRYKGIFQLGWSPFGLSPFDPVASALSTAATVKREGWGRWECKPG